MRVGLLGKIIRLERRISDLGIGCQGLLVILSGASGTGKDTVIRELMKESKGFELSVSVTTREPRGEEKDGVDYFFVKKDEFKQKIENSELLEYAQYCGNFYGTPKANVLDVISEGRDVILEIEVEGKAKVKESYPDAVSIFILPPSMDVLRERLGGRGSDDHVVIEKRLRRAQEEIDCARGYDYVVVNDSLGECVQDILKIVETEHMRVKRSSYIIDEVLKNG